MFMFPGVGSQCSGMGKTFYDQFQPVRDLFSEASDILHCDMHKLCFSPEKAAELDRLENAQVALLCVSVAAYRVLVEETGLEQGIYLGYSFGEYSALCCAGALAFADAVRLVRDRGAMIIDTIAAIEGSMAWVVNLKAEPVEQICRRLQQEDEKIFISAYDSPIKTSISGTRQALAKAGEQVVRAGGIPLPIKMSGPFHSPLMQPAADRFRPVLDTYSYKAPKFPVISNLTARPYETAEEIAHHLTFHLVNPIRWQASLEFAFEQGATTSIEIGPKNVLTYLLKENTGNTGMYTIDTVQALKGLQRDISAKREQYLKFIAKSLTIINGTRNYNEDLQEYEEKVLSVFRKMQALYKQVECRAVVPDADLCQNIIEMLGNALSAKKLTDGEVAAHIKKVAGML